MKILVIQKKFMGDVLVCSVVFRSLKEKFPNAELHYLISKNYFQVVENHEFIDKFIFFEDRLSDTIKTVRKEKYDAVIDTYSKIETALIAFLSGAKKRMGYFKKYTQFFYTHPIHRRDAEFQLMTTGIEHRLQLLEPLGIPLKISKPEIFVTQAEKNRAKKLLEEYGIDFDKKIVMMSTFGSTPEKSYPYMKDILETVATNSNAQILCNYIPSQKDDFIELYSKLSKHAQNRLIKSFDTKNLREFIAVLTFCDALIGNEGGSTNISKAIGIPTFSIFAPFVAKESWNWFDDGTKNISIHVGDFATENRSYHEFKPDFFSKQLVIFVKNHLI